MGNSHANTTFDPKIIDAILGTESIHVNTSGESIYQTYYEYLEVLRYQNPKVVIIETFPIYNGLTKDELKSWNFSFFYSMPTSIRKFVYGLRFFSDDNLFNLFFPYTIFHSDWKKPNEVITRAIEELKILRDNFRSDNQIDLPYQGYVNYLVSLSPGEIEIDTSNKTNACQIPDLSDRLTVTKKILETNKEHFEDLLFVEAPQFINKYEKCRSRVLEMLETYDVSYVNLFEEKDRSLLWFGDDQHMTQFGAVIASVETAELLADKLGIDMNPKLLEYYRGYSFQDYTLIHENNEMSMRLVPVNDETVSSLDFIWTISLDGEPLYKIKGTGRNELTYTLPKPKGDYFIHVMIHNPAGDYYLRGGFYLILGDE